MVAGVDVGGLRVGVVGERVRSSSAESAGHGVETGGLG